MVSKMLKQIYEFLLVSIDDTHFILFTNTFFSKNTLYPPCYSAHCVSMILPYFCSKQLIHKFCELNSKLLLFLLQLVQGLNLSSNQIISLNPVSSSLIAAICC